MALYEAKSGLNRNFEMIFEYFCHKVKLDHYRGEESSILTIKNIRNLKKYVHFYSKIINGL